MKKTPTRTIYFAVSNNNITKDIIGVTIDEDLDTDDARELLEVSLVGTDLVINNDMVIRKVANLFIVPDTYQEGFPNYRANNILFALSELFGDPNDFDPIVDSDEQVIHIFDGTHFTVKIVGSADSPILRFVSEEDVDEHLIYINEVFTTDDIDAFKEYLDQFATDRDS